MFLRNDLFNCTDGDLGFFGRLKDLTEKHFEDDGDVDKNRLGQDCLDSVDSFVNNKAQIVPDSWQQPQSKSILKLVSLPMSLCLQSLTNNLPEFKTISKV